MAPRPPIATVMLRTGSHYRGPSFVTGLTRIGYDTRNAFPPAVQAGDVLVIWNRYASWDVWASRYEAAGAHVLVAENGYIGKRTVALSAHHHNGAGKWGVGPVPRWPRLNIEPKPWRANGEHILVLPSRGVGPPGVAMPKGWLNGTVSRLKKATRRPIRVREHPGIDKPSLDPDLKNAWACVTWGSGAGIKALVGGVPVFHELPQWIGAPAAVHGIENLESPYTGDRAPMLERLAWAQWSVDEIESGEAFRLLLPCT